MSRTSPPQRNVWLPVDLESLTWEVRAHRRLVRARLADLDVLAEAITDPRVARRVLIDQAVDLRRSLLAQAEQARRIPDVPRWSQPKASPRRDDEQEQVALAALETVPQPSTAGPGLVVTLQASADAVRPLAEALVDQAGMDEVAERSVTACRYYLVLTDMLATTVHATSGRE